MDAEFTVGRADGLATITLARPGRGNQLSIAGVEQLAQTVRELTGPVVLTGRGPDFCLGRDTSDSPASTDPDLVLTRVLQPILDLYQALDDSHATVVAAVRGRALGLGFALAAAADVIVAERTARFALPESRAGFPPLLVLRVIAGLLPRQAAFHLAATGAEVDAPALASAGVISVLTDPGDLTDAATEYARALGTPAAGIKTFLRRRAAAGSAADAAYAGPTLAAFLATQAAQSTPGTPS